MVTRFSCTIDGSHIAARFQGELTAETLEQCQALLLSLVRDTNIQAILYDLREVASPCAALIHQETLEPELQVHKFRRAVLVRDLSIGYLARLAFAADSCRVFYNDLAGAMQHLSGRAANTSAWGIAVGEDRRIRERRSQAERQVAGRRLSRDSPQRDR